ASGRQAPPGYSDVPVQDASPKRAPAQAAPPDWSVQVQRPSAPSAAQQPELQPQQPQLLPEDTEDVEQNQQNALQNGTVKDMRRQDISVDPDRFQFKQKAIGHGGTTEELRDVKKFDPEKAGVLGVWTDPADGK